MLQNHSSVTLFTICLHITISLMRDIVHNLYKRVSDERMHKMLSSYSLPKQRYGPLTLYMKKGSPQVTKSVKHDNIKNVPH